MSNLFRVILSMSLSGSALILIILLIRPLLKERFSNAWQYYIWMIVLIRLFVPYSPEYGLVNDLFHTNVIHNLTAEFLDGKSAAGDTIDEKNTSAVQQTSGQQGSIAHNADMPAAANVSGNPAISVQVYYSKLAWNAASFLWLAGVILLLLFKMFQYILFIRAIRREAEPITDYEIIKLYRRTLRNLGIRRGPRLLLLNQASSPMLIGIFRPAIYLTDMVLQLEEENLSYVLRHELMHYKRHDIWYKWFCELALSIHWFNPLIYRMSRQMNSQCEISCDEAVARDLSVEERRIYGNILLNTAAENIRYNKHILSTTLYEDNKSLKERILSIMNTRRKTKKTIIFSVLVAFLICTTAFMLGAYSSKEDTSEANAEVQKDAGTNTVAEAIPSPSTQELTTDTADNGNGSSDSSVTSDEQNTAEDNSSPATDNSDTSTNADNESASQDAAAADETAGGNQDNEVSNNDSITYYNTKYGFDFDLPASWEGYTIQSEDWQGTALEGDQQGKVVEAGTKIMIRHPKWIADDPRQDIPIMVFTLDQWDQVVNEKIAVSAAPLPPSELGRNSKYVFALPARYNFAYSTGYEEVDKIIQGGALVGNEYFK